MNSTGHSFPRAGFFRRIAAMIYDLLVAVAVGMCAAMVIIFSMILLLENGALSMGEYEHTSDLIQNSWEYKAVIQSWVLLWVVGFFLWFWKNGGQTIGMRAWRLRLFSTNERPLSYSRALLRIICSIGGIGTLLVFLDVKNKQSLQDRIANTEMLVLTKDANHHKAWKDL